jgi:hypothetical protein
MFLAVDGLARGSGEVFRGIGLWSIDMVGVIIIVISAFFSGLSDKKLKSLTRGVDNKNMVNNTVNKDFFGKPAVRRVKE